MVEVRRCGDATDRTERTKHGVFDDDTMLNAFNNPMRAEHLDDGPTMLIGPDPAGNLYEIGGVDTTDGPISSTLWLPAQST